MIRVAIVSPQHALRVGLREMLGRQTGIKVTGEASVLESVNGRETEVVVLAPVSSTRFPEGGPPFAVLFVTDDVEIVRAMLGATPPAWGILSPDASEDELGAAVRAVAEGLWVGAPGLVGSLIRLPGGRASAGEETLIEPLTGRELEVLQWMAQGLANKQVALKLGISEHTVKFHLSALYAKLNIASRTEAVKRGIELGLISL